MGGGVGVKIITPFSKIITIVEVGKVTEVGLSQFF